VVKPLQGIKILDLSQLLPGPLCTQMLADYGADVIKIEPITGEFGRIANTKGPGGNSHHYFNVNRNKKSLALDLKSNEGKEILKKLVEHADVIFEQYRPETMNNLGLGYEELKKVNDRIIYCALTGYGYSGPLKMTAGHDNNYLSIAGILGITGTKEAPGLAGIQIADVAGGTLHAVIAILMALRARELTGKGQFCDVGMLDGCSTTLAYTLADYWANDKVPQRAGEDLNGGLGCYQIYKTADNKYVALGAMEPKFWHDFCKKIGKEEWTGKNLIKEPVFQNGIIQYLSNMFQTKTQADWVAYFANDDICFTPVLGVDEAIEHPQMVERELVIKVENFGGTGKAALFPGLPIKLSETPGEAVLKFSNLGQDTSDILRNIGYTDEQIDSYIASKVVKG